MDVPLAHLDRPFDYLVPAELDEVAIPGTRVKVRFAGQLVDGWLLSRADDSGHTGRLAYLEKVVSPEPVLAPEVARLARAVADRYAGNLADVLRLAVPPRHARVEKEARDDEPGPTAVAEAAAVDPRGWRDYPTGPALLRALTDGRAPRAVWSALPGEDWAARYADAVAATVAGGAGRSSWCPMPVTSTGWTPRSPACSVRDGTSASPPRSGRPGATGRSSPPAAARCQW